MYLLEKRNKKNVFFFSKRHIKKIKEQRDDFGVHVTTHFSPHKEKISNKAGRIKLVQSARRFGIREVSDEDSIGRDITGYLLDISWYVFIYQPLCTSLIISPFRD